MTRLVFKRPPPIAGDKIVLTGEKTTAIAWPKGGEIPFLIFDMRLIKARKFLTFAGQLLLLSAPI